MGFYPERLAPSFPAAHEYNYAVGGTTLNPSGTNTLVSVSRLAQVNAIGPRFYPVISVLIGRNDMGDVGQAWDQTTFLNEYIAYLDARRSGGYRTICATVLPSTAANINTRRNAVNPTIVGWLGTHCDAIADFAANATIGPDAAASDTTYYSDGTHPTNAGQAILTTIMTTALQSLGVH